MKKSSILFLLPLAVLASCSSEKGQEPENLVPGYLQVHGTVNELTTRASGSSWEAGDQIGVTSADGKYANILFTTADGTGAFTSATEVKIAEGATVSYSAYYPYNAAVTAAAPEIAFDTPADYMWATASATYSNPKAAFAFSHKMSKITLTLTDSKAGAGVTGGSVMVNGVAVAGTFNTATGVVTPSDTKTSTESKAFTLDTQLEFLLPAQTATAITVTIGYGDKNYGGTLKVNGSALLALAEGTQYNYTIDLSQTHGDTPEVTTNLEIDSATVTGWVSNDGDSTELEEVDVPEPANVLEIGDFLLSDGTVIDKNSPNIAKKKGLIEGVVYYVGNAQPSVLQASTYTETQDILRNEYPDAVNGLAIAISNYSETAARFSTGAGKYVSLSKTAGYEILATNYILDNFSKTTSSAMLLGYNNTRVIQKAKELGSESDASVVTMIETFNTNHPVANATSWYIPSNGELELVKANYDAVKASIEKAGGTLLQYPGFNEMTEDSEGNRTYARNENFYWTSDQRNDTNNWGNSLSADAASANVVRNSSSNKGYTRFSIVF